MLSLEEDSSQAGNTMFPSHLDIDISCQYPSPICDYMIGEEIYEMSPDESDRQILDLVVRQAHTEPPPQIYYGTSTEEVKKERRVIPAKDLYNKFPEAPELPQVNRRATNIPKFLFNLAVSLLLASPSPIESGRYTRWMTSLSKRFVNNRHQARSRFTLMQIFCDELNDCEERRSWKRLHRELMKQRLATHRTRHILLNNVIHKDNRLDYLYYCKLYEWRLNDQALLNHIK